MATAPLPQPVGYGSSVPPCESSELLPRQYDRQLDEVHPRQRTALIVLGWVSAGLALLFVAATMIGDEYGENYPNSKETSLVLRASPRVQNIDDRDFDDEYQLTEKFDKKSKKEKKKKKAESRATRRCDWVVNLFTEKYAGKPEEELRVQYNVQASDANFFYRATANIFWLDFVNGWGDRLSFENLGIKAVHSDGTPLQPKSTWTWVTGDQHLSNFGAWRNRHGDVVFSVNDFDEAAIFDFQVDVLRIAVSVCSHAYTNGLSEPDIKQVLRSFTDTYVTTAMTYVGSDKELLYELTPRTATGSLKTFLEDLRDDKSAKAQLEKFTELDADGNRRFLRNERTKLVKVDPDVVKKIREQFTIHHYGATMMKMGWHVRGWDDDYFEILDVAARIGSGVGSYGVDRYYILLQGTDGSLGEDGADGNAVILDVKYEPPGAVSRVLTSEDADWYANIFSNDADRAVEGQRRLTSYVDPFTGWVVIDDKPFVVRQRSPWKAAPDLDSLTDPDEFTEFMEQVAVATATSHVRGTVSKSPGQFKHVIASVLGHWIDRRAWGIAVEKVANEYREQVLLDFQCFKEYVEENYS